MHIKFSRARREILCDTNVTNESRELTSSQLAPSIGDPLSLLWNKGTSTTYPAISYAYECL